MPTGLLNMWFGVMIAQREKLKGPYWKNKYDRRFGR
jgi:hypothetical protein